MKIIDMRVHSIAIADPPLRSSYGLHAPYALRTILEIESEDGIIGISETYGGEVPARTLEAVREKVIGQNPYRLTGLLSSMVRWWKVKAPESTAPRPTLCPVKILLIKQLELMQLSKWPALT